MNEISALDPRLALIAIECMTRAADALAPSRIEITVTWRDPIAQDAAAAAGLSKAHAGESPHNCTFEFSPASRAFDFAVFNADRSYVKDGADPRYRIVGEIGKALGLEWGGDWTPEKDRCEPDYDHLQLAGWKTLPALDEVATL